MTKSGPDRNEPPPLWVFLHLAKCGGTTIQAHIAKHMAIDEEFVTLSNWGAQRRALTGKEPFERLSADQRKKVRVLGGHYTYYGIHHRIPEKRSARYFTVLRDPAERCVSLYNFRHAKHRAGDDFDQWYAQSYLPDDRNSMVRFYASRLFGTDLPADPAQQLAMAKKLLDLCWLVTTLDRLDDTLAVISDAMGLPHDWTRYRVAGDSAALPDVIPMPTENVEHRFVLDAATRERIYADAREDLELFRWAQDRFALPRP